LWVSVIFRWMDGSLFFRGLTAVMDFLRKVAMGSFIVGWFTGEDRRQREKGRDIEPEGALKLGFFAELADTVFNGWQSRLSGEKLFRPPKNWPQGLSNLARGSWVVGLLSGSLATPIPDGKAAKGPLSDGLRPALTWAFFALPVWGMAAVTLAAPALPTMVMAGLLVPVFLFAILSRPFEITPLTVALILFIAVNFLGGFLSATPGSSLRIAALVSLFMLVALIIPAVCREKSSVDFFFLVFLAGAGLTGIVGLYQVLAGYVGQLYLDMEVFWDIRFRVVSTLGNPNVYGMYLVLAVPLAAACVFFLKHPLLKILCAGLTGLLLVNLLLTYSRGSYLALAITVGVFVLIMEKRFVVLFIPALMTVPFLLPPAMMNRLLSIFDMTDTSAAFRISIWRGSVRIIQDFWMSGIGQGAEAFNRIFPYYAPAAAVAEHSHNLILQVILELGIVGLVVFIAVLACYFRVMVNFLRRATELRLRLMAAALVAAVIGFLFQGLTDHVFYNFRVLLVFYIFMGLGIAFAKAYDAPPDAPNKDDTPIVSGYSDFS